MVCATLKAGSKRAFMTNTGCGYNGGTRHPIVEQCGGCQHGAEYPSGKFCNSYPNPSIKWKSSNCNFATHAGLETKNEQKTNPPKASKRNNQKK
ncbi:MAG: PxxKW family cysteine-rich protein [Syntrophobacter sp.]